MLSVVFAYRIAMRFSKGGKIKHLKVKAVRIMFNGNISFAVPNYPVDYIGVYAGAVRRYSHYPVDVVFLGSVIALIAVAIKLIGE